MSNILNSSVMTGLISASSFGKLQQVATGEYNKAKSRGDEGAMERSMGYATNSMQGAFSSLEDTKKAMEESAANVREEQKVEEKTALEKARAEKTTETNTDNVRIAEPNSQQTAIPQSQPAAILELSNDYISTVQNASSNEHEIEVTGNEIVNTNTPKTNPVSNALTDRIYTK